MADRGAQTTWLWFHPNQMPRPVRTPRTNWGLLLVFVFLVTALMSGCDTSDSVSTTTSETSTTTTTPTTTQPSITTTTSASMTRTAAYFVGNSLTNDTLGPESQGFRSFYVLATQADHMMDPLGWHIRCGSSLEAIAANPDDTCVDPVVGIGTFDEAIPRTAWDYIVVQPYQSPASTLETDLAFIQTIADAAGPTSTILILTGWPGHADFDDTWADTSPIADDSRTTHSRNYFETLLRRARARVVNNIALIPSAEVLYRIDEHLREGDVPGLSSRADLYRDDIHLNSIGGWLSGVTAASVMTGTDPQTFGKPSSWYGDNGDFSAEYIALVRSIVADVLAETG